MRVSICLRSAIAILPDKANAQTSTAATMRLVLWFVAVLAAITWASPVEGVERKLQTSSVFINEFHYDNTGSDVSEFLEVAIVGTVANVQQYRILLINGKNGKQYKNFQLGSSATFVTYSPGLVFAVVSTSGIRDGSYGDGIVLLNDASNIVQFLCYEKNVRARNGLAAGESCRQLLPVKETGSTPVGYSLQLSGNGCEYGDFVWQQPQPDTPGEPNQGQTISCGVAPTDIPSLSPSAEPSLFPSAVPSSVPSLSMYPSVQPSNEPSLSIMPSYRPSGTTTSSATTSLTTASSTTKTSTTTALEPSVEPSGNPSAVPSSDPSKKPSPSPVDLQTGEEICPTGRLDPPEKFLIAPYADTVAGDGVEDDLNEISYIVLSDKTSASGDRYAYVASDKEQFSLKVLQITDNIFGGTGTVVATYTLNVPYDNDDWEDIALAPCTDSNEGSVYTVDETCIYIGNIGNNNRDGYQQRDVLKVFKFVEPDIDTVSRQDVNIDVATIEFQYAVGFSQNIKHDAEAMFVDWTGVSGSTTENRGDIYIVTKNESDKCNGGVGKIPVSFHKSVPPGTSTSVYFMDAVMTTPPSQGIGITCNDGPFRAWTGADMRHDGRLIAMIRRGLPASVHFFPRLPNQSVKDALSDQPCPYASATSIGLPNEKKHEAVAFVDADGSRFVDISECEESCSPNLYMYKLRYPYSNVEDPEEPTTRWSDITFDTFELDWGSYMSGGTSAYHVATAAACSGVATAEVRDDLGIDSSFYHKEDHNCSSFDLLRITFQFRFAGYDPMDSLFVEMSLNSLTDFHIVGAMTRGVNGFDQGNVCYNGYVLLSPAQFGKLNFGDNVRLRFRSSANSPDDRVYVDNIRFEGYNP